MTNRSEKILDLLYAKQEGNSVDIKALDSNDKLSEAFAGVLENYDRERVYASDIKKLFRLVQPSHCRRHDRVHRDRGISF